MAALISPEKADHTMDVICTHVAQGGSLIDLCEAWQVVYGHVTRWIHSDETRDELYKQSLQDRNEWGKESVLNQIRMIANADIRQLFDKDGNLLPVDQWDPDIAKSVAGIDVTFDKDGNRVNKIKSNDKLKAIELFGKTIALFKEEVQHVHSLADLISMANKLEGGKK